MSDSHSETFAGYARRCALVFAAVLCGTLVMVGAAQAPLANHGLVIAMVLAGACVNAFLVAGYLMHLLSERKLIYALLIFTAIFFVGLMGLTIGAAHDVPTVAAH